MVTKMNQNEGLEQTDGCHTAEHKTTKRRKTAQEIIVFTEEMIKNPPIGSWAWKVKYGLDTE